jgi:tRNA-dihydrouridine synthase
MKSFWSELEQPFFALAPMEAVTDVIFRHVVAAAAPPDVWFTEFTNATGWVHAGEKATGGRLIKTDDERPIVAQIWGGEPGDMEQLALHCHELGYDGIDINMGCPAKSAIKSGGSALIRQPKLAAESIAAAKLAGPPVSVKTRLGYTHIDEWRDWLTHLLRQDIANLTIHLRTKKEMSKVPAHHELIPQIVQLRDEIAPHTLLTINGDIADRAQGEQIVRDNPGVNGVMIGRGIFQSPFAFAKEGTRNYEQTQPTAQSAKAISVPGDSGLPPEARQDKSVRSAERAPGTEDGLGAEPEGSDLPLERRQEIVVQRTRVPEGGDGHVAERDTEDGGWELGVRDWEMGSEKWRITHEAHPPTPNAQLPTPNYHSEHTKALLSLLALHLDLYDQWHTHTGRPYETLKRFYKIYIRDFDGACSVRDQLMHTKTTEEARQLLRDL